MADDRQVLTLLTEAESGDIQPVLRVLKLLLDLSEEAKQTADDLERMGDDAERAGDDLERLGDDAKRAATGTGQLDRQLDELGDALRRAEGRVQGLESELTDLRGKLDDARKGASDFDGGFKGASEALVGFQRRIGELALDAVKDAVVAGTVAVADFSEAMARLETNTGAVGPQLQEMRDLARQIGATTDRSADEVAAGFFEMSKAGFSAAEIIASGAAQIQLAQVAFTDTASAASAAATQIRSFGGTAADLQVFVDQMAQAGQANTTILEVAEALERIAPAATLANNAMGANAQSATDLQAEMAGLVQVIADVGGITGATAGEGIQRLIQRLQQAEERGGAAGEELERLGLTFSDINPAVVGTTQALQNLADANLGTQSGYRIVGEEAQKFFNILTQNMGAVDAAADGMERAEGRGKQLADGYQRNLRGAYAMLTSAAKDLAIEIGDTGAEDAATTAMNILTRSFNDNKEVAHALGVVFGTTTSAINALANALVTGFTVAVDGVTALVQKLGVEIGERMQDISRAIGLFSEDMAEDWRLAGEEMEKISREKMVRAMRRAENAGRDGAKAFGQIGSDLAKIFGATGEEAEKMSEKARSALKKVAESSADVELTVEQIEALREVFEATGEESEEAGQKLLDLSVKALKLADDVNEGLENLGGDELESFRSRSEDSIRKTLDAFVDLGAEIPPPLIDALVKVSDKFDELPEKVGASIERVRGRALELTAGIRHALEEGFETPEALEEFSAGVRPQVEAILDDFERLGEAVPPHLQKVADSVGALPQELRKVQEILDSLIDGEKIADEVATITAAFESLSDKTTDQVKDRFGQMTADLVDKAKYAGVAVPEEIRAIRDELGLTAEAALAAKQTIQGAFEGMAEKIDFSAAEGGAAQIRGAFLDIVNSSDEMKAAFASLDDATAAELTGLIEGLEQAARNGEAGTRQVEIFEDRVRALLETSKPDDLQAFNEALRGVGDSADRTAASTQQATEAARGNKVVWDEATQSMKTVKEDAQAASEALKVPGAAEGAESMEKAKEAAQGAGEAAMDAGAGFAEAADGAATAAEGLGDAAAAGEEAAAAQGAIAEEAAAALAPIAELVALVERLTGVDLSALNGQLQEMAGNVDGVTASVVRLDEATISAGKSTATLAENMDAVEGEGGAPAGGGE